MRPHPGVRFIELLLNFRMDIHCVSIEVFMSPDTVILIDAYSQIFRSFYAIRHLSNSRGEPVNALLVFTRLLLGIERSYPGKRGAMLFDCGKVQHRIELLPEYKANRPPMPEELRAQIPFIREMASAFGWQMHEVENYEADDLIGVLALNLDGRVKIVSSDKDLSQLVCDRITMLSPANGNAGGFEERDAEFVKSKFGVEPALIIDYLALLGDSSDNIDGVKGIGAKGAAQLLNTYGASSNWIDAPETLDKKFASKLDGQCDILRRNIKLVSLRTELPENWSDTEALVVRRTPDWGRVAELCRHYGLKSVLKDLPEIAAAEEKAKAAPEPQAGDEADLFSFMTSAPAVAETEKLPEQNANGGEVIQGELF